MLTLVSCEEELTGFVDFMNLSLTLHLQCIDSKMEKRAHPTLPLITKEQYLACAGDICR